MLLSLMLQDWKSFGPDPDELTFAPLTLLVGPNGSGKSNVLDALRFLQGAALDYPLGDVLRGRYEGQREVWPRIRGGIAEASRVGQPHFALTTEWRLSSAPTTLLQHYVVVDTGDTLAVADEWLRDNEHGARYLDTGDEALGQRIGRSPGGGLRAAMRGVGRGRSPSHEFNSARWLVGQLDETHERLHPDVLVAAQSLKATLRNITFLDIRPDLMRDYRPQNGGHLGTSGENISPTLLALANDARTDVVEWLSELVSPEVDRIEFDVTALKEVMLMLVQGDVRTSARSASDGTLRFLGLVVALLAAPKDTLVILEEPDVGLHPARIRLLVELLEYVTRERGIQVIATTHSPTVLAHLSQESLGAVIAFARDRESGYTVGKRLDTLEHFPVLRDAKNIESLISTGWLERAL